MIDIKCGKTLCAGTCRNALCVDRMYRQPLLTYVLFAKERYKYTKKPKGYPSYKEIPNLQQEQPEITDDVVRENEDHEQNNNTLEKQNGSAKINKRRSIRVNKETTLEDSPKKKETNFMTDQRAANVNTEVKVKDNQHIQHEIYRNTVYEEGPVSKSNTVKVNYNCQEILSFVSNSWQKVENELASGTNIFYYSSNTDKITNTNKKQPPDNESGIEEPRKYTTTDTQKSLKINTTETDATIEPPDKMVQSTNNQSSTKRDHNTSKLFEVLHNRDNGDTLFNAIEGHFNSSGRKYCDNQKALLSDRKNENINVGEKTDIDKKNNDNGYQDLILNSDSFPSSDGYPENIFDKLKQYSVNNAEKGTAQKNIGVKNFTYASINQ